MSAAMNPLSSPGKRPLWSVMIPVHNCAELLERALPEVVAQLVGRADVQIEVVDDASADDPAGVVERFGQGAVGFHRNEVGLGAAANFNECVRRSTGRLVHILHGDDMVLPGFYAAFERALADDRLAAAVCRVEYVDADDQPTKVTRSERDGSGKWDDALETLAVSNRVRPAGIVVPRDSYEQFGGFDETLPHAADWEMWARLAASGPVWFIDEVLARYRVHEASDTAERLRTGVNVTERLKAIETILRHVPAESRSRLSRRATLYSAAFALRTAARFARHRDAGTAAVQLRESVRCLVRALRPGSRSG